MIHTTRPVRPVRKLRGLRPLCLLLLLGSFQLPALAQQCAGPLRLVVGLSPGGGMDSLSRLLAQRLGTRYGYNIVVENKVGASGNIAAEYVARAPKDGCTLIARGNEHNVNPLIYAKAGYEPKDFSPVIRAVSGPAVIMVAPNQPFKTMAGMVEFAKTNPGKLSYGSSGIGGANHIAMEIFLKTARLDVVHIPYKGAAPAIADTASGVVPLAVGSAAAAQPFITAGKLIPLAVTGPTRWPTLPSVPTLTEAGFPDATYLYWTGILAPAGTPMAVREKFNTELQAILEEPQVRERLQMQGYDAVGESVAAFEKFLQDDERTSRKLMQELKVKVE